ncbi:MAG: site-2 protease family protein [Bacteroidota bacterium]|nr:site-2 protease family protein [Bacteroidota bacterium]
MKRTINLFTIKGIVIKMHWTFLILPIWIIAANAVKGFTWANIIWSLIFILLVFLSVVIHELAHYWATKRFKIQTKEIILMPTGGISSYENFPKSSKEELLTTLAGTLANLAIAGLLLPFIQDHEPIWAITSHFDIVHGNDLLYKLHIVNLGLFAINLLPAFPLDGGHILRVLLGLKMNYFKATRIVVVVGKILAAFFLVTGIFYLNLLLLVISLLIFGAVESEEYVLHLRSLVKGLTFGEVVVNDYQKLQAQSTVQEVMGTLMTNHVKHFFVMENGIPIGTVHRMSIINEAAEKNYTCPVKNLMKENLIYFNSNDKVETGFKTLVAYPYSNYPVMQDNLFTGVISLMCILEHLMLHQLTPKEHQRLKALIKKI